MVAFLKGKTFINIINPSLNPSTGNHIPDKTDWPTITTDAMPPIDFSLHSEPNIIPSPINSSDVNALNKMPSNIFTDQNEKSIIPPTKKNKTD